MPASLEEFTDVALLLRERVELGPGQLFRLVGVGMSNFQVDTESASPLFEETASEDAAVLLASNVATD
jgi:DNA polymerase IV